MQGSPACCEACKSLQKYAWTIYPRIIRVRNGHTHMHRYTCARMYTHIYIHIHTHNFLLADMDLLMKHFLLIEQAQQAVLL